MSPDRYLVLRLEGPLQSWGFDSQYSRRNTALMPTKSAIAGICCAALGYPRGCGDEQRFLDKFKSVRMTTIAIPRTCNKREIPVRRLLDYHTVQNTRTAKGDYKDCHITHRQYLMDASFGVVLEGDREFLHKIAVALDDPIWGIWLGRKTCIPTVPIYAGLKDDWKEALRLLLGDQPVDSFTMQEEVNNFVDGRDSISDLPESFALDRRLFSPRRIITKQRKEM